MSEYGTFEFTHGEWEYIDRAWMEETRTEFDMSGTVGMVGYEVTVPLPCGVDPSEIFGAQISGKFTAEDGSSVEGEWRCIDVGEATLSTGSFTATVPILRLRSTGVMVVHDPEEAEPARQCVYSAESSRTGEVSALFTDMGEALKFCGNRLEMREYEVFQTADEARKAGK